MTNGMIFKQALLKAFNNGWIHFGMSAAIEKGSPLEYTEEDWNNLVLKPQGYYSIIFSKDFAKAFWKEKDEDVTIIVVDPNDVIGRSVWQAHLQRMVLADDPISYLAKFLD